jgi:hypothetical protein
MIIEFFSELIIRSNIEHYNKLTLILTAYGPKDPT